MAELILERSERIALRRESHHLSPGVLVGEKGMTDAVMKEIDRVLSDHGLVKVHVAGDDRDELEALYHTIAETLGAARIQMIGKMLVFYRPVSEERKAKEEAKAAILMSKADPGARGIKKPAVGKPKKSTAKPPSSRKEVKRLAARKKRASTKKSALSK